MSRVPYKLTNQARNSAALFAFCTAICVLLCVGPTAVGRAEDNARSRELTAELAELSLEELMNIEVISASKKTEKLSEAAAAIFVITQEDIRRSGVTCIPEALRMAPGIQVARIDANKWAISARGFNDRFANKLLVMIDGRTVYTPLFSGVFWDLQDTMIEDVERIEVIRGPGSTLWGANAVNGVINIITKKAKDTQGGLAAAGGGTEERGFGAVRYGSKAGDTAHYRVYAKYFNRDGFVDDAGRDANDDWESWRGGFRSDWEPSSRDGFTFHGDIYDNSAGQTLQVLSLTSPFSRIVSEDVANFGGNLLTRWEHSFSDSSAMALQVYYDYTQRDGLPISEDRDTFDVDLQHRFALCERHDLIWGLGYRITHDEIDDSFSFQFNRESRLDDLWSTFVQDDITLFPDRLHLILGSKFEHNDYTGFEIQPNARLLWTPHPQHTLWAAVSRAIRTPSRTESDARGNAAVIPPDNIFPGSPLALVSVFGNPDLSSEELIAYELGYRVQPTHALFLDFALFYNDYDEIVSVVAIDPFFEIIDGQRRLVLPFVGANSVTGESYGAELAMDWHVLSWWRLQLAYTYLHMDLDSDQDNQLWEFLARSGTSPEHQCSLRSSLDLTRSLQLDLWLRYVDTLPHRDVDSYATMDARLAWKPTRKLELALVGQNLFEDHHAEFGTVISLPSEVQRGVYGKITWQF